MLTNIHLPPTVPCPWLQCWHLSPSTFVQFQQGHWLLLEVMVSAHPAHANNSWNTLLVIKYGKTNKHCSLAYYLISHRLHKPCPPSRGTCFVLHCMSIQCSEIVQHRKCRATCSPHQSHILAVQLFQHIALAHALIQSQCPYCVHQCKKAIRPVKFGLSMPHLVHSSITNAFHAFKINSFYL